MTRAIILAAGSGTRLRPLTDHCPKCLVPLAGKALLDHQTEVLKICGIHHIHIVAGYCAEQIKMRGYSFSINKNYATTNMVETLFSCRDYLRGTDDLLITYGDIIYQPNNLRALLAGVDAINVMVDMKWRDYWDLRFTDPLSDAETLKCDHAGYITELGKKPHSFADIQGQYTGLIKVRADKINAFIDFYEALDRDMEYDGKDFANMYLTSFLQALINAGWKIKAVPVMNGWLEVDSVEDLQKYETLASLGQLGRFYQLDNKSL